MKENPGPRSYRVVYANIWDLHKNFCQICLSLLGVEMCFFFCSEIFFSSRCHIFEELMIPDFYRPMQRSEVVSSSIVFARWIGLRVDCICA